MSGLSGNGMSAKQALDAYFLETRCKIIEVAANLDRVDRGAGRQDVAEDKRLAFVREALDILRGSEANRAERILQLYSLPDQPR